MFEKLTPLFNYISSNIDEFMQKDILYHPHCYFSIIVKLHFDHPTWGEYVDKNGEMFTKSINFLNVFYGMNGLNKNIDIFQKIKTDIKKELLEKNPYNIIFNT